MAEKEYIERELAEKTIDRFAGYLDDDMIFRIKYAIRKHIPAADVAPVVHCKDCKYAQTNNFGVSSNIVLCCLETSKSVRQMDDFCSYGERKENENAEIH